MFKLERLEITGFKSFADYTEILFTGDGITAIVGPNGCGKSNVADAIAWVLGEQRVKHLRGGEMKDVIFQGARNRPPSGMAEVVMHMIRDEVDEVEPDIEDIDSTLERIDDRLVNIDEIIPQETAEAATEPSEVAPGSDQTAPDATPSEPTPTQKITHKRHWRRRNLALEFAPGEAVSVTRRLYRSGESEYLLNGKICRLRDIQDLFSGTGLAGGHYAIIEQGRIGQILSAKPMDRRTIIEEAAGITKFRVRQRATEARLDSARSNLSRISDIVSEIDRQVNSLRRQAAKARRYGVLREELRELLRHVYVAEDQKLAHVLEETKSKLAEITELEVGIADDLNKREEAARAATHEARSLEDTLSTVRASAAEAVLRRDRQARECVYQKEQLSEIEKRKAEVTAEIEALTSRLVLIESECRRLQQEDARLREEFDQSALVLRTAEESYAEKLSASNAAEIEIESSRAELLSQTAIAERVREIARQLETTLERLSQQAESLAREGDRAASQHAERKLEAERYARELGDARARVAKLQAEREVAVDAVVRGHEAVSDTEAELTRVRDEHSRASHRLESLKELDNRRAYYSPAVQLIFSATETPRDFHFIGTLADALNVDAKWERAVEGVLGSSLQSIVVPTPDDAVRAAQWLRENNGGRASFLVAGLHGGSEEVEEVDALTALTCRLEERPLLLTSGSTEPVGEDLRISDLLGAPQQLVTVLKRTLPQKMDARIAANLEDAMVKSIATGEMYVTLNGDWIASGQFVNAGDARDLEEGAGLLAFKRELRELETRAEALALEVDTVASSAKDARARMVELEDAVVLLNEAIGREEREALAHEHTTTSLEQEVERAERHMRVVGQDSARVDEERIEIENRRAQALLEAEAAETAREAAADKVIKASALLADLRREAETESDSLAQQRAAAAAASERRRATTAELRRIEGELADFAARVDRHRMELAEMGGRSDELTLSIADLELAASTVESDRAREEEQIADLSNRLQEARRQADEFSAELSELNRRAAEVRDSRGGLEVQRAEAQARQTFVHENCQTELGQSLEDLARELTFPEEFDLETSHTRVEELRTRLEGFGGVNMMALEELAEAEQRLLFLTVQRQDIIEGISATEEALREIKRRSRERFRHAFEQINKNFSSLFLELFGGGRGEMSLIDADDVLESGIDVVAQPPGKRLQNVLLLSGGEKAMAALALVLGIFHYRPAPFCLLDEVDAPLDEANVGRFTDKVVQMSADTQFIVITHNKRTMEMARALYGVTMEEAGVSKLVSVKFE